MKTLAEIFNKHEGYSASKWSVYLDAYQRYFEKYRDKEVVILEIGINYGGSLEVWRKFFGPNARIIGVDINERCKSLKIDAEIYIGSQSDRKFLRELKSKIPPVDVLIDDGGHTMRQQLITFEELWDHVKDDGIYVCEDLHTSYWKKFGGGFRRNGTFIEFSKKLVDQLNANHTQQRVFQPNYFTRSAYSLHFFDSLLIIEKKKDHANKLLEAGREVPYSGFVVGETKVGKWTKSVVDRILMFFRIKDVFRR